MTSLLGLPKEESRYASCRKALRSLFLQCRLVAFRASKRDSSVWVRVECSDILEPLQLSNYGQGKATQQLRSLLACWLVTTKLPHVNKQLNFSLSYSDNSPQADSLRDEFATLPQQVTIKSTDIERWRLSPSQKTEDLSDQSIYVVSGIQSIQRLVRTVLA